VEAALTEETTCDENAQPYRRFQDRGVKSKRAAVPRGRSKTTTTPKDEPGEESEFELQLRSTLA
jgi:hypothetical protein